jgi:hypothetical protein
MRRASFIFGIAAGACLGSAAISSIQAGEDQRLSHRAAFNTMTSELRSETGRHLTQMAGELTAATALGVIGFVLNKRRR